MTSSLFGRNWLFWPVFTKSSEDPPIAHAEYVEKVRALYRKEYGVELSSDGAKRLLEQVMHFIYLTEVEEHLRPLFDEREKDG